MADTTAFFVSNLGVQSAIDPFDFASVFMPLVDLPDTVPPEVENFLPSGVFGPDELIEFDIPGEVAAVFVTVFIGDPGRPRMAETIWDGEDFTDFYREESDRVNEEGANVHFSLGRVGGWPSYPLEFRIKAVDKRGNVS
jgi:hypothetical protein